MGSAKNAPKKSVSKRSGSGGAKSQSARPAEIPPRTILFTGFPGFIGRRIIARLFELDPEVRIVALVQPKFVAAAQVAATEVVERADVAARRLTVASGDIARSDMGLDDDVLERVRAEVTAVWHLAAIYDLTIGEAAAYRVNVEGTRNVLDLCAGLRRFERLVYFSTCYVSGKRSGRILETELEMGQAFKNHYESTKFKAEVLVHQRMNTLPTDVIRPAIVIGDSRTGDVDKFDGPYPVFRLLALLEARGLLRKGMRLPMLGTGDALVNLVPVDFVVEASCRIGLANDTPGQVYQLCDPNPLRARELYQRAYTYFGLGEAFGAVPSPVLRAAAKIPVVADLLKIPEQALDYLDHFVEYDSAHTRAALESAGVRCPDIREYLPVILEHVRKHARFSGGAKY
ncbi:MAG: SDR family oxidoreductase [Deltaproteobacteria bacterium]|nr:SDR family oxidoreductase [Deltaproteobacteria bacterium]